MKKESPYFSIQNTTKVGFTLAEMLLVVSLMSVIGLAAYQAITNGIAVWKHGQQLTVEGDVAVFFDRISGDLHNAFIYPGIEFSGERDKLSFATIVQIPEDKKKNPQAMALIHQIGQVQYAYDAIKDAVVRQQANYSQALNKKFSSPRIILEAVRGFEFRYHYFSNGSEKIESSAKDGLPQIVEIVVSFTEKSGQTQNLQRLVYLSGLEE